MKLPIIVFSYKHSLQEDEYLKELVNQVMVRNRREDTGIEWTSRNVQTIPIEFTDEEREVYDMILELKKCLVCIFGFLFNDNIAKGNV